MGRQSIGGAVLFGGSAKVIAWRPELPTLNRRPTIGDGTRAGRVWILVFGISLVFGAWFLVFISPWAHHFSSHPWPPPNQTRDCHLGAGCYAGGAWL